MKFTNYLGLFLLLSGICVAQDRAPFTKGKEFYLKGSATVIGNSILGKKESKAFNNLAKVNDEFKMRYIDIDNDSNTWSSSSAYFSIPKEATIVYASLYWTATYRGERSAERLSDDAFVYKKLEDRAHDPQKVKLKTNTKSYQDITGELVYDGEKAKNRTIRSRAPYAYVADVTEQLKGFYKGDVTVANVGATQGNILGGSSAGWLLYVVYENKEAPLQYITTYHGLESIKKQEVEIDFGSFKSSKDRELSTQITIGALEGDRTLDKDQVKIYNPKSNSFVSFGNELRPTNNFFNSSITKGNDIVLSRKPNSKNTLGFDIAELSIHKKLNAILATSSENVKMQFSTRGDDYFLFFMAFQTTISEAFYNAKKRAKNEAVALSKKTKKIPFQEKLIEQPKVVKETVLSTALVQETTVVLTDPLSKIINQPSVEIPGQARGFYIISNVFSIRENALKWESTLKSKELYSSTFFRPDNQLFYVSLGGNTDAFIMYEILKKKRETPSLEKSWILKVNM